jgi:hypothetical protein
MELGDAERQSGRKSGEGRAGEEGAILKHRILRQTSGYYNIYSLTNKQPVLSAATISERCGGSVQRCKTQGVEKWALRRENVLFMHYAVHTCS